MTEEQRKAIRELAISIAHEEKVKPFLREFADLLEKHEIVLEFNAETDSVDILNKRGDVIYEVACRWMSPDAIRAEVEQ